MGTGRDALRVGWVADLSNQHAPLNEKTPAEGGRPPRGRCSEGEPEPISGGCRNRTRPGAAGEIAGRDRLGDPGTILMRSCDAHSIARVVPNCNSASLIVPNLDQHWLCDFHSDRCFFIAGSFSLSKNPTVGVGLSGLSTGRI